MVACDGVMVVSDVNSNLEDNSKSRAIFASYLDEAVVGRFVGGFGVADDAR